MEPPTEMPAEVERELALVDREALRASARFGTHVAAAYLALFPILYWIGFREVWYLSAGPAICVAIIADEHFVAPRYPHRRLIRPWTLALLTAVCTLAPWLLELAGVLATKTSVSGSSIILSTAAVELDPHATLAGLFIYIVALIHLAGLLARMSDDDRRSVRRAMQLQSWQLRQLVAQAPSKQPPGA